jgi:hypothetical protein
MSGRSKAIAVVAVLMFSALPAQAHSPSEINAWLSDWEQRHLLLHVIPTAGLIELDLTLQNLTDEYAEIRTRHAWWDGQPVAIAPIRTTQSVNRSMGSDVERWRTLVATYFVSEKVNIALCIMEHESGGNPDAKNPLSSAAGLFQFLQSTWDGMIPNSVAGGSYDSGAPYDPEKNVRAAAWLQAAEGWSQWNQWNQGECR